MEFPPWLVQGIDTFGYWVVLLAIAIESTGIPFPGETTLVLAAAYAGTRHSLNIELVIVAAAAGAILGDNAGYTLGRYGGYPLLRRILAILHVRQDTLLYTQRYFAKHGDKTVFFGRFIAVLRAWAAFLAGTNHMPRRSFFLWNAAGGIVWATAYGILGYVLGDNLPLLERILRDLGIAGFVILGVIVAAAIGLWVMRRRRRQRMLHRLATEATLAGDNLTVPPLLRTETVTRPQASDGTSPQPSRPARPERASSRHTRRRQARR
jgi:membrane protein DedA with SNARE-associated domain